LILPALIAIASVACGAALGFLRGDARRPLRAIQLAALAAALGVALLQLLPEALEALGGVALVAFALPLVPLLRPASHSARALAVELGYAALLLHQLADGVLLGAYGGVIHPARAHLPLLAAVALHTIPVGAAVALSFDRRDGRRAALGRVAGMAGASLLGVALTGWIPIEVARRVDPWASAVIAGLLLETVLQGWRAALRPAEPPTSRA
jgi:zinc transporter ZupT